jgi:broad specificity phosphatase PhoE
VSTVKIMIIRHAEKPDGDAGVGPDGAADTESLTVRGWQRSGALVGLFAPAGGHFASPSLATPQKIFASGIGHHSNSNRPQQTVTPLAAKLGLTIDTSHLKEDEAALAQAAAVAGGNVLIAWEHERIPDIARAIVGDSAPIPQPWPDDRFDIVWVFDRDPGTSGTWSFSQTPQSLLAGDRIELIPLP